MRWDGRESRISHGSFFVGRAMDGGLWLSDDLGQKSQAPQDSPGGILGSAGSSLLLVGLARVSDI